MKKNKSNLPVSYKITYVNTRTEEKVEVRHTTETETTHLQSILITSMFSIKLFIVI